MAMLELDANATVAVKLADCALLLVQLWRGVKVDKFDPGPQLGVGVACSISTASLTQSDGLSVHSCLEFFAQFFVQRW